MRKTLFLIIMITIGACAAASAEGPNPLAVPLEISYQGRLLDADGNNIEGIRKFQFAIYDAPSGGELKWGPQEKDNVAVIDGHYSVVLGGVQDGPITEAFSGGPRYLGIKVVGAGESFDGATEIARPRFLSAPYSMTARTSANSIGKRDQNLRIKNSPGSPDDKVQISFDYLTLYDDRGFIYVKSVSAGSAIIVDMSSPTGAGHLDSGVEMPDTWYYIWVIYDPVAESLEGLFSESRENPTLPDGYAAKRLVGAIYNDQENGNFRKINQVDKRVVTEPHTADFTASSEFQDFVLPVPETARRVYGYNRHNSFYVQQLSSEPYPVPDETNSAYGLGTVTVGEIVCDLTAWHNYPFSIALTLPKKFINRNKHIAYNDSSPPRQITITGWEY